MKISLITVCFNAAATLADTIESVRQQDGVELEHILIDGGSTDGTLAIAESYSGHFAHRLSEPDHGLYDAMNKGLALASGDIVGILNADDRYAHHGVLKAVVRSFQDSSVDACYADLVYVNSRDEIVRYWRSGIHTPGRCSYGWMPAHPTFYARRQCYQQFGDFDLSYKRQADFEFMLRWFEVHRLRARYIPEIWIRMRSGGASNSPSWMIKGNWESYRAVRAHHFRRDPFTFFFRKFAWRIPQLWQRPSELSTLDMIKD